MLIYFIKKKVIAIKLNLKKKICALFLTSLTTNWGGSSLTIRTVLYRLISCPASIFSVVL